MIQLRSGERLSITEPPDASLPQPAL